MSEDMPSLSKLHTCLVQAIFFFSISVGAQNASLTNASEVVVPIARSIVYLYLIRGSREGIKLAYQAFYTKDSAKFARIRHDHQNHCWLFIGAVFLLLYWRQKIFGDELIYLFVATLLTQYLDMVNESKMVTYGKGMACSYFEGYLAHVLPSNGYMYEGFENNLRKYESTQSVRVPVKKLFIIITKDLYCPPNLREFNKDNAIDRPYLETTTTLESIVKDVAGVTGRVYRNSMYKIVRPAGAGPPVYVAAECASPLHTLYLALRNRALSDELQGIDKKEVVSHFCNMLETILRKCPECQNKCHLIFFDNSDPNQYLPEILLQEIRDLEPNFEEIIRRED